MPGVIRTRVGYAGGAKADPTYRSLGDHMETIQLDYDPNKVTYSQLLEVFWSSHDPFARPFSRQYASAVFYHDQEQKELALASAARLQAKRGGKVRTEIAPSGRFYVAEDYHQKYSLQGSRPYMAEFRRLYPGNTARALRDSTLAARLNGYLAGSGDLATLSQELPAMGLSAKIGRHLWELASQRHRGAKVACPLPAAAGAGS